MKAFKIGTYQLCHHWVNLIADPHGDGGNFIFISPRDKKHSQIEVGMDYGCLDDAWQVLMHEALEFAIAEERGRFQRSGSFCQRSSDSYYFFFDHNQLSEVAAKVGYFTWQCFADFEKAWERCHRKKKNHPRNV